METKDILASIEETKDLIRRVRTPGGARRYGQPIGSIIVRDKITPRAPRQGTRRARSMERDRRRAEERVEVEPAQVAPSPDVASGSDEEVSVNNKPFLDGGRGSVYTDGMKYVTNDPLIASKLDYAFLKKGTPKQAKERMEALGFKVNVGVTAAKNREFMTMLSEVSRILEEEFPGFAERHGHYYSMGVKGRTAAFNVMHSKSKRDEIDVRDSTDGIYKSELYTDGAREAIERSGINSTYTTFTSGTMKAGNLDAQMTRFSATRSGQSWMSMTDGLETFRKKGLTDDQIWQMHVITHELGHAVGHTVAGRIGFSLDDQKDENQEQRRWYREYYANSRLKLLDEMGIVKWTGKEYVADTLIDQQAADEWHRRFDPGVRPAHPKIPTSRASAKTWDKYRATKDKYHEDLQAWIEDKRRKDAAKERALAAGEKEPAISASMDDVVMGYSMSRKNLSTIMKAWADQGFIKKDPKFKGKDVYSVHDNTALKKMTSEYGSTNWLEVEAETWAAYMLNGKVTEGVSRWGEQMHTMLQWWTDDNEAMRSKS